MSQRKKKQFRVFSEVAPSDLIKCLVAEDPKVNSSYIVECEACHRTHLSQKWRVGLDEQTIQCVETSIKENPEKYCITKCNEPVYHSEYDGKVVVMECPCFFLAREEEKLLRMRDFNNEFYDRVDRANRKKLLKIVAQKSRFRVVK